MKKYFTFIVVMLLLFTSSSVSASQTVQLDSEAKAVLIKELTIKLNELIIELNALVAGQDARIRSEVSTSRVNAELYYTLDSQRGYAGACQDIKTRIKNSLLLTKSNMKFESLSISCFDSANNYALSIKTSKGYSCADSTGAMKDTAAAATGVMCS